MTNIALAQSAVGLANATSATSAAMTTTSGSVFWFGVAFQVGAGITLPPQTITDSKGNSLLQIPGNTRAATSQTVANPGVWTLNSAFSTANQAVFITAGLSGIIPGGFTANTVYYVVNISGTTCQLSTTPGGAGVQCTSSHSCTLNLIACDFNTRLILRWNSNAATVGGAGHTCTATFGGTANISCVFAEISAGAASGLDQSNWAGAASASPPQSSGNVVLTPPVTGELMLSMFTTENPSVSITFTEQASGMTINQSETNGTLTHPAFAFASIVETASATYHAGWTDAAGSGNYLATIDTFEGIIPGVPIAWLT